jgi:hypothetical protein
VRRLTVTVIGFHLRPLCQGSLCHPLSTDLARVQAGRRCIGTDTVEVD